MKKMSVLMVILVILVVGITGCGGTPPIISLNITYPDTFAQLNGNGTCEITWDWVGPSNKKVNIILIGYTQSEEEMGTMLIDSNVLGANGSYIWGPNFGESIFLNFGVDEDWPWWFKVKVEVVESEVYSFSEFFSVQWIR